MRALITGVTGQDGFYLSNFLKSKGYEVFGTTSSPAKSSDTIAYSNLLDKIHMLNMLEKFEPDEVYNLAAPSFMNTSWQSPILTNEIIGVSVVRWMDAILNVNATIKLFQACSSEVFGMSVDSRQCECTTFAPRNPYAASKAYAYWMIDCYRRKHGIFACNGILFTHESPRRSVEFVARKIVTSAVRIKAGMSKQLVLGSLGAMRDWGYAGDYVEAMWMMLQNKEPKDYVIGTGNAFSVGQFCDCAFSHLGLNYLDYVKVDIHSVKGSDSYMRADPSKIKEDLDWSASMGFEELVTFLVEEERRRLEELNGKAEM